MTEEEERRLHRRRFYKAEQEAGPEALAEIAARGQRP